MITKTRTEIKKSLWGIIFGIPRILRIPMIPMLLIILTAALPAAANTQNIKIEELNQKIADIALLQQQLNDRSEQVAAIRSALQNQRNGLAAEISILSRSLKITAYPEAADQLRIHYNLELLCSISAYLDELEIKALFYQNGRNKLKYLQQLAEDDVKMISTINDLKIEALVTQISLMVNRYLPEAHVIQINTDHIIKPSARTIWQQITAQQN